MSYSTLTVDLKERSYDIYIGEGLLQSAATLIKPVLPLNNAFIITDENVAKLHLKPLQNSLSEAGIESHCSILPAGEQTKSFNQLEQLLNEIFEKKPERKSTLIALGGGVIGDLTGFAASILLRGVNFIQIPTTLLAQVDSSVGGKTGINNTYGKNLIGSFYQPKLVLADTTVLQALPKREFLSGYAEVVKYALINNYAFFEWLVDNEKKIINMEPHTLQEAIKISCQSKAEIVANDEKEAGCRALLNLGHTFGHALEKETGYSDILRHGESVAIGMVLAHQLSAKMGMCSKEEPKKVEKHLKTVGLPTSLHDVDTDWNVENLLEAMYQDKKVSEGKLVFILTKGIGKAFINKGVDAKEVEHFLRSKI